MGAGVSSGRNGDKIMEIKNNVIRVALVFMAVISIMGCIIFGSVFVDIASKGTIYSIFYEGILTSSIDEEKMFEQMFSYLEDNNFEDLASLDESLDYYVTSLNGTPVIKSENWYYSYQKYGSEKMQIRSNEKYVVRFIITYNKQLDEGYVLLSKYWGILRKHIFASFLGGLICALLLGVSVWMIITNSSITYKLLLLFGCIALAEYGGILFLKLPQTNKLISVVILEKCLLYVMVVIYLHKQQLVRKKVQAISHPEKALKKEIRLPMSLMEFSKDVDEAAVSIDKAIKERSKSDRMKTELISNVSHDLKTPLTSIINFSDLILKENIENEVAKDYAVHLHTQSIRLKQLMDSLIEASKASSGAIDIEPVPCRVQTILEQCVIEYEDKLSRKNISLVDIPTDEGMMINADVKALCRIFENLLNNICKYALPGSRAYIDVKREDGKISIYFKNVSAEQINMSPDELTERFVRGDASRHSEGYGLGLSIVKSLMNLMEGDMEVTAEFDMFVVKLMFPIIAETDSL